MKRARPCLGTLSRENAAHPLVQILTQKNFSTIRLQLYKELNVDRDGVAFWSLLHLVPGVLLPRPYMDPLWLAKSTIVEYSELVSIDFQRKILALYRRDYSDIHRMEGSLEKAISNNAPLHFLRFLWNEHLDAKAKIAYVDCIFRADNHFSDFGSSRDGSNIVTFLWENVFHPNINDERMTDTLLDHYMEIFVYSHYSFATICWFQTQLYPYELISWSLPDLYGLAMRGHNFPMVKDCFTCMSNDDKDNALHSVPHVYDILYNPDFDRTMTCDASEILEFLQFLFSKHGLCSISQFWSLAYCFTEGQCYNESLNMFLVTYHANHFPSTLSGNEAACIIKYLEDSTGSCQDHGFSWFLAEQMPGIMAQLVSHPFFTNWLQDLLVRFKASRSFFRDETYILENLKLSESILKPFRAEKP